MTIKENLVYRWEETKESIWTNLSVYSDEYIMQMSANLHIA